MGAPPLIVPLAEPACLVCKQLKPANEAQGGTGHK